MNKLFLLIIGSFFLNACGTLDLFEDSNKKSKLEGERLSLYDFEKTLQQDPETQFGMDGTENQTLITLPESLKGGPDKSISLVAPWTNNFWPQVGGYPNHSMKHLNLTESEPEKLWSRSIGEGGSDRTPLTSNPVMADGKVFTLNNDSEVYAITADNGDLLWTKDVLKPGEDEVVIGGGLAYSGGRLFVTNGFNEIVCLNPKNGEILWRTETKNPVRAAPAAVPGRVFITTMDNQTIAFDADNGKKIWSHRGLNSEAGVLGAATPAVIRDAVITAYSSGEIYALQINTGLELWSENLSPLARVAGKTTLSDIQALPVVDSGVVYAASYTNRMNAIDGRTGEVLWQAPIGTASIPWISGNRIYVIETQGTLVSVDRNTGNIVWQTALQRFEDEDDREDVIYWQGPVLAGKRLLVFGSNGTAQSYNPIDGSFIREWDTNGDILVAPAIANENLYLLSNEGRVSAWN